ncbi:glycoside hydrolase [Pseudomonas sp. LTJR-52]|uniref:glycoside hydrolase family 24 protein n=1 Tax=Pseudomonas sp. LTJR-52 TaxID=2479392 RepID=UPI000EFCAA17|nr:glycoside hydrolase family 104 protein [Pseudomonas sp. LTJR-52]AYN94414.1 glycoside hydrolase [Pseudomonas sp. LTJR-52]
MARITADKAGGENVIAFLDTIAFSEIGKAMLADASTDDGYRVLVGSTPNKLILMRDYSDHPNIYYKPLNSTAAGRYQILYRYWPHYKAKLNLQDFGPINQDLYAIQQLKEQGAYRHIQSGHFEEAIYKCRNIWASLPGAGYGQPEHRMENLVAAYKQAGGSLA